MSDIFTIHDFENEQQWLKGRMNGIGGSDASVTIGRNPYKSNVSVQEAIAKAMAERSKRTGISQDRVIQELARIAFVNPQNVINPKDASVKADATEDDLACIQSVKVKTMDGAKGKSVEREVRLNDKMKALELLGKHLGMFKDKLEVDADMDLNITIDYGDNDNEES